MRTIRGSDTEGSKPMYADGDELAVESVRSALDELFLVAQQYRRSEKFNELLEFVSRFKRYSMFNAMLVHVQMPGARYVLPTKQWIRDYGRWPKEGAQPLVMLQPKGPVMSGIDVAQSDGRDLPSGFDNPFQVRGNVQPEQVDRAPSGLSAEQRTGTRTMPTPSPQCRTHKRKAPN